MRKITSDSDFDAVNRILLNFYNAYPSWQDFQTQTPAHIVDDYLLFLAVKDFMSANGWIEYNTGKCRITQKGIEIIENYEGNIKLYLKGRKTVNVEDNFFLPVNLEYYSKKKEKADGKIQIWHLIVGILAIATAIIIALFQHYFK